MASSAVGSIAGGGINTKRNRTQFTLIASGVLQLLGNGLMITLRDAYPTPQKQFGFQVLLGIGFGLAVSTATIMAQLHAEPKWAGEYMTTCAE